MYRFDVCTTIGPPEAKGRKAVELMRMFGLSASSIRKQRKTVQASFALDAGQIVFITGASGAGKSTLLRALYEQAPAEQRLRLDDIELDERQIAIDCMGDAGADLHACLEAMNRAGLGDVFCMLREPGRLSVGEQARYRLAKALAGSRQLIFADEFTSSVDRITALAVSYHLRKTATRCGKSFIVASCHEDITEELGADIVIRL